MGTTVENVSQKKYTDLSGFFHEGMTVEEAQNKKGLFSIFSKPVKEFYRIDTDNNGVLSKDEITAELRNDADAEGRAVKHNSLWGLGFATFGLLSKKIFKKHNKIALLMTGLNLLAAIHSKYMQNVAKERIAQGCN